MAEIDALIGAAAPVDRVIVVRIRDISAVAAKKLGSGGGKAAGMIQSFLPGTTTGLVAGELRDQMAREGIVADVWVVETPPQGGISPPIEVGKVAAVGAVGAGIMVGIVAAIWAAVRLAFRR